MVALKRGGDDIHPLCVGLISPAFINGDYVEVDEMIFIKQVMLQTLCKFVKLDGHADTTRFSQISFTPCVHKAGFDSFRAWRRKHRDAEASYVSGRSCTKSVYHSPGDADAAEVQGL